MKTSLFYRWFLKYTQMMLEDFFEKNRLRIGILLILIYAPLLFALLYF